MEILEELSEDAAWDERVDARLLELLGPMVSVPTVVPPGDNYREYVDLITPSFESLDFETEEVVVPQRLVDKMPYELEGPRVNLVATRDLGRERWITFYGHIDVVPAGSDWTRPPFELTRRGRDKVYGRGVADMKGAMAALLLALEEVERLGLEPRYNIRVVNCTDEELGVYPGARYLAKEGYIEPPVWCMEGISAPLLLAGAAGVMNVEVRTVGRSAHSGMNFLGVNALEGMVPILSELMSLKVDVEQRESEDIPGLSAAGGGSMMSPMFNLDIIRAGEKANVIPSECSLTINRRLIPEEDPRRAREEIEEAVELGHKRGGALGVETDFRYEYPALRMDTSAPVARRLARVISEVQGVDEGDIHRLAFSASTDMGFVARELGTKDIVMHGVGNPGSSVHGADESIRLRDARLFVKEAILFLCDESGD